MKRLQLLQDRLVQSLKELCSNKGSATLVFAAVLLIYVCIPIAFYQIERSIVTETKKHIERAVVVSALAALKDIDNDALAYGDVNLNKDAAKETFLYYLSQNLDLDANMTPRKGLIKVPIVIKELEIYSSQDVPATCSQGTQILLPSVHVVLDTSITRDFYSNKLGKDINIEVHKDVDIYTRF